MNTPGPQKPIDIRERSFDFAVRVIKLCKYLEKRSAVDSIILSQLLKAGTSVGANLEARAGQSSADYIHKNAISLKEARESHYWLRLILATETLDDNVRHGVEGLKDESMELAKIIGKIIVTAKSKG